MPTREAAWGARAGESGATLRVLGFIRGLAGGGKLEEAKSSCSVRAPQCNYLQNQVGVEQQQQQCEQLGLFGVIREGLVGWF